MTDWVEKNYQPICAKITYKKSTDTHCSYSQSLIAFHFTKKDIYPYCSWYQITQKFDNINFDLNCFAEPFRIGSRTCFLYIMWPKISQSNMSCGALYVRFFVYPWRTLLNATIDYLRCTLLLKSYRWSIRCKHESNARAPAVVDSFWNGSIRTRSVKIPILYIKLHLKKSIFWNWN